MGEQLEQWMKGPQYMRALANPKDPLFDEAVHFNDPENCGTSEIIFLGDQIRICKYKIWDYWKGNLCKNKESEYDEKKCPYHSRSRHPIPEKSGLAEKAETPEVEVS